MVFIEDWGLIPQSRSNYYTDGKRHLVCLPYSIENLHKMAVDLGIKRCWFHKNHYDVPHSKLTDISSQCFIISSKDIVRIIKGNYMTRVTLHDCNSEPVTIDLNEVVKFNPVRNAYTKTEIVFGSGPAVYVIETIHEIEAKRRVG